MKTHSMLYALAAVAVLVLAVLLFASFSPGAGPTQAANAFFQNLADKGPQAAYGTTSPAFQAATTQDAFAGAVQSKGLTNYKSANWSQHTVKGASAELTGVLNLKTGGALPVAMDLVKGATGWSVLSLNLPNGGLTGAEAGAAPPPGNQMGAPPSAYPQDQPPPRGPAVPAGAAAGMTGAGMSAGATGAA